MYCRLLAKLSWLLRCGDVHPFFSCCVLGLFVVCSCPSLSSAVTAHYNRGKLSKKEVVLSGFLTASATASKALPTPIREAFFGNKVAKCQIR